jgi:aminopeptidase
VKVSDIIAFTADWGIMGRVIPRVVEIRDGRFYTKGDNAPSRDKGHRTAKDIEGVRLKFEKGEVVDYSAEKEEKTLKGIIEIDDGFRRLGEMAIGTNRGIKRHTLNMLFDEKIGDTIHCALGRAYKDCNGVNESAVHVDMIKSMTEGEVTAGDEIIYAKGKYFYEM